MVSTNRFRTFPLTQAGHDRSHDVVADGLGLVVVDHTHLLLELLLRPDVVLLSAELVGELFLCELVAGLGLQRVRDIRDSEVDFATCLAKSSKACKL